MNIVKVISTEIEKKIRFIKFLRFGKIDVQNVKEVSPFGIDGNPLKDMVALYAETSIKGKNYIVGYINPNAISKPGELRLYSLKADGSEAAYCYLKDDGTIEVLGNADNLVRYSKLNSGLQAEKEKINAELAKIAAAITSLGGSYTVTPVSIDISEAKISEIKTT